MALAAILNSLDGLSDDIKAEYKENPNGDGFLLDVTATDGYSLENVAKLKDALAEVKDERAKARSKLKEFHDAGVEDPVAAAEAIKALKELGDDPGSEEKHKKAIEAVKATLSDKHTKEMSEKDERVTNLIEQLTQSLKDSTIKRVLLKLGGDALLEAEMAKSVEVVETDGVFGTKVVDENGIERISPTADSTAPMTIEELGQEFQNNDRYAQFFKGSGDTGGGGTTTDDRRTTSRSAAKDFEKAISDPNVSGADLLDQARAAETPASA